MISEKERDERRYFYGSVYEQLMDVHRRQPTNEEVLLTMAAFLADNISDIKGMMEEIHRMKITKARIEKEFEQKKAIK